MPLRHTQDVLDRVISQLTAVRQAAVDVEHAHQHDVEAAAETHRDSARNLLHYVGMRSHDLRHLQTELSCLGLSSLGRTEAHVLAGIDAPLFALHRLAGSLPPAANQDPPVDHASGPAALQRHARALFGDDPAGRAVRIMVTAGSELATDPSLARHLLDAGMDLLRINAAHDGPDAWGAMVRHVRRAAHDLHRPVRILFDLAGPKLRTGPILTSQSIAHWRPKHDERGTVVRAASIWLTSADAPADAPGGPGAFDAALPVPAALLRTVAPGDRLEFTDCRGRARAIVVSTSPVGGGCAASADSGAYVESGTELALLRGGVELRRGRVGSFPPADGAIVLCPGDLLIVHAGTEPGRPASRTPDGKLLEPATVPCTLPEVFPDVKAGERIWFDDGKIGGIVDQVGPTTLRVRITNAKPDGSRLLADKGVNLPDSALTLPALTAKDLVDLDFAARHVDMVGLSFVRREDDVLALEREMDARSARHLGVVLKIENAAAFERLPRILLAALRSPPVGVMIARGDLAVELGFERLAEVQEEILWICEAAHVPVIWATQVLESLSKKGSPSRAEVTDAAMSARAECVMLNKGPHAVEAVRFLDDVLGRMAAHQTKKRSMLRRLGVSHFE